MIFLVLIWDNNNDDAAL